MSFPRIVVPVVVLSLFCSFLCFVISDKGTPVAEAKLRAIRGQVASNQYIYTQKIKLVTLDGGDCISFYR